MADIDYKVVFAVNDSWDQIKRIPNYESVAGELLFRKIFEIAPAALNMFSFGAEFLGKEEELYQSESFKAHSVGVVKMLDAAVDMIGPDLDDVAKVLADLGAKHVGFGVLPAHYGIVGEALLHTLETALGGPDAGWTPKVKQGWTVLYAFVSTAMLAGANRRMDKIKRRKARLAKLNGESAPVMSPKADKRQRRLSIPSEVLAELGEGEALPASSQRKLDQLADTLRYDYADDSESGHDDLTQTTCSTSEDDTGEVAYSQMMESVSTSWEIVKTIPNCTQVAGVLLFKNIFEIAPEAKALFPFAASYEDNDEGLYKDPAFLIHARGVVRMLDASVNLLGPDLEPLTRTLEELGARHAQYNIVGAHYPIVGEALLKTLETVLGDKWTPTVRAGWVSIFAFISTSMQNGAEQALAEGLEEQTEI